jgi:hypothetical protein
MEKVKIFVLLFDPDCKHCSGKNGDIKRIQKDSKGMNQKAHASAIKLQGQLQMITRPTCHRVPWVPSGHCSHCS